MKHEITKRGSEFDTTPLCPHVIAMQHLCVAVFNKTCPTTHSLASNHMQSRQKCVRLVSCSTQKRHTDFCFEEQRANAKVSSADAWTAVAACMCLFAPCSLPSAAADFGLLLVHHITPNLYPREARCTWYSLLQQKLLDSRFCP